ncbi:MAG: HEAT repeat domain-containing protein [Planctomycetota bacterium]
MLATRLPGQFIVVAIALLASGSIDAAGLRPLPPGDLTPAQQRSLDDLVASPDYFSPAMRLREQANEGVFHALEALSTNKDKEVRGRAGYALVLIASKETLGAAIRIALTDKEVRVRETIATGLMSREIAELMTEAGLLEECKKGLADKKLEVRLAFALILQINHDPSGIAVLEKGLAHRDHHWQETSAEALAELGNDAGGAILIKMLNYDDKNHPLIRANPEARADQAALASLLETINDERVRVCGHLAKLRHRQALPVLEKLTRSQVARVAEAAKVAIEAIGKESP